MKRNVSSTKLSKNEHGEREITITYHPTLLQLLFNRPGTTEVYVEPNGRFAWFEKESFKRAKQDKEFLIFDLIVMMQYTVKE